MRGKIKMRAITTLMMALVLLISAMPALAGGPDKVEVCHLNDDGGLHVISIADPALDAHIAHGDQQIGIDVDENCQPLTVWPSGCLFLGNIFTTPVYGLLSGEAVQFAGGEALYLNVDCNTTLDPDRLPDFFYWVWANSQSEADSICTGLGGDQALFSDVVPNLYACGIPG